MTAPDRIPCLRHPQGCRRTAPRDGSVEIVCGKCWRAFVPPRLKNRYKVLNRHLRRLERQMSPDHDRIEHVDELLEMNWRAIRRALLTPAKPAGLDTFLEASGL